MAQDAQRTGPKAMLNRASAKGPVSLRARDGRWNTRFGRWMSGYGVPNVRAALRRQRILTGETTVYEYLAARKVPRADVAYALVRLSRGKLTMDDVYRHCREVRRAGTGGSTPTVVEGTTERDWRE